jgi:hypothetical protein
MNSLPAILRKVTPIAGLLALTLTFAGCDSEQAQVDPVVPNVHGVSYGESAVSLPQDVRHHQRTTRTVQLRHATPPPEGFTGGN